VLASAELEKDDIENTWMSFVDELSSEQYKLSFVILQELITLCHIVLSCCWLVETRGKQSGL